MARRIRAFDWSGTSLGPIAGWQQSLKTAVDLMLDSAFASYIWWGPELIQLYNDPAIAISARGHPEMLGAPARVAWTDVWDAAGALVERVRSTGIAELGEDLPRVSRRGSESETAWFTCSYSPLRDQNGLVSGLFITAIETTARVRAAAELKQREAELTRVQVVGGVAGIDINIPNRLRARRSPEYLRLHGLSPGDEHETHEDWLRRVHPDDRERVEATLMAALAAPGASYRSEYRIIRPSDGEERWIFAKAEIERDAKGKAIRLVGAHIDVTERKGAEQALRESEERLRLVQAVGGIGSFDYDLQKDYGFGSPEYYGLLGLPEGAPLDGKIWRGLMHPDDQAMAVADLDRAIAGQGPQDFEYRIVRADNGEVRWLSGRAAILADAEGRPRRYVGAATDVTARKTVEKALRESEERFRSLVEGVPQIVWRSANRGQWIWVSPQWTELTGQPRQDSHGLGWLDAVHPQDRSRALELWLRTETTGHFQADYRLCHRDTGAYRWFQTRALPVRDASGRIVEWLGTSTDVENMRQLQETQQVLVAELQHRTRNLMAVVRSIATQTIRSTATMEEFQHNFRDRLNALDRVQGLLSRADSSPITIGRLVQMELDALSAQGNDVSVQGPEVKLRPSSVQTLALAIHELATNARKYGALKTPDGKLNVTWERKEQGVVIDWIESGVDLTRERPMNRGYGRELIEKALPYSLGARTEYELTSGGVRCRIELPLSARR